MTLALAAAAPVAPAAAPAMPGTRLLTPTEQVARRPLASWSAELLARYAAAQGDALGRAVAVTEVGNAAALVAAHAGRLDDAERIVRAQVGWLRARAARTGCAAVEALALQPGINLGRLDALRGLPDAALRRDAEVRACRADSDSPLMGGVVTSAQWGGAGWTAPALELFGRAVWVMDGLRVLLGAGRWAGVLEMAESGVDAGTERLPLFLREARLVALARLGRADEGLDEATAHAATAGGWDRMVAQVRRAELLRATGDEAGARRLLGALVEVCGKLGAIPRLQLPVLLVLQQVATLALALDAAPGAEALAGEVMEGARAHDDEVLRAELLRALSQHAVDAGDRRRHADALAALRAASGYARLRPGACPPPAAEAVDALVSGSLAVLEDA